MIFHRLGERVSDVFSLYPYGHSDRVKELLERKATSLRSKWGSSSTDNEFLIFHISILILSWSSITAKFFKLFLPHFGDPGIIEVQKSHYLLPLCIGLDLVFEKTDTKSHPGNSSIIRGKCPCIQTYWIPAFAGMTGTYPILSFPRRRESISYYP